MEQHLSAQPPTCKQPIAIDQLVENYGSEAAVRVLKIFLETTPPLLERMAQSVQSRQAISARDIAHELKGTCAMLQLDGLACVCKELERCCRESSWSEADILVEKAKDDFASAEAPIKNFCQGEAHHHH